MKKKNRKHSIIDSLPSDLREAVDEMIKADFTYHEIAEYIRRNNVQISVSSVQRYASNLNETLQSLRLAQENFRAVMEETEKYRNPDVIDGILRLLSSQIFQAVNNFPDENLNETDFETLMKNAVALTRAVAYKKKIDIDSRSVLENGGKPIEPSKIYVTPNGDKMIMSGILRNYSGTEIDYNLRQRKANIFVTIAGREHKITLPAVCI